MKHAFLITAYNNFANLNRLLELLDDNRSIVFLHIDKKVHTSQNIYKPSFAQLYTVPAMNVRWGDVSQIECILSLIEYALDYDWDYCHYLSESDMPLKTISEIDAVFSENRGKEFVDFAPKNYDFAHYKCDVYRYFTRFSAYRNSKLLKILNHGIARLQWWTGYRRRNIKYYHGSAFFSVTKECALFIDKHKTVVLQAYAYSLGPDEVWLQTLLMSSEYKEKLYMFESLYMGNLRYIDWSRRHGNSPYTFTTADFEDLVSKGQHTELCFARKFSANSECATLLKKYLLTKEV